METIAFDLENPFSRYLEDRSETLETLFESESDHIPSEDYIRCLKDGNFNVSNREEAISEIIKFSPNFVPLIPYVAVNYFDRFVSTHGMAFDQLENQFPILILKHGNLTIVKLIAMSCLSLAAKMMKNSFLLSHHLQKQEGFIFDSETIQRMEILILGSLKWKMRSITPFAFVHFFICLFKLKDDRSLQSLRDRATQILFKAQNEIEMFEFKPSIIAASVLLSVSQELFPKQFPCYKKAICPSPFVNEEKMSHCCKVVQDLLMEVSSTAGLYWL